MTPATVSPLPRYLALAYAVLVVYASTDPAARRNYVVGLAGLYVADPRFAANYGGDEGATFVRQALEHYAEARL